MSKDAEEVARLLREDYESPDPDAPPAMVALFADTVEVRHIPGRPTDGPLPGSLLRAGATAETDAVRRALPDAVRTDIDVTVDGAFVRTRAITIGTLADGTEVIVPTDVRVEVRDGRIVALEAQLDDERAATWAKVLAAGGFSMDR